VAARYWVGGTADWDATAGSKWSTTSGGAGGSAVPTAADDVFLDANSGAVTITLNTGGGTCLSFNATGFTGTFIKGTLGTVYLGTGASLGNITLGSGMTLTSMQFVPAATSGTMNVTSNGVTWVEGLLNTAPGTTVSLQDNLTMTKTVAQGQIVAIGGGTFTTNGFSITVDSVSANFANTKVFNLGASTITLTGTGTVWGVDAATTTVNAGTSTINITDTSATAKTFAGGGKTYNNVTFTGGNSASIVLTGANTFNTLTLGDTATYTFPASTTTTVSSLVANAGTLNSISIISSSAGTAATISDASGANTVKKCSIKDSTATGGAIFNAVASTSVSGNTGWNFIVLARLTEFIKFFY